MFPSVLRVVFLPYAGFTQIKPHSKKKPSRRNINKIFNWEGMVPDIFETLASDLNFSYSLALSRDGNWGSKDAQSGDWNGIIKDLMDGIADVSPAPLIIMNSRSLVVEYLPPFYTEETTLLVSSQSSYLSWIFLAPFHISVWIIICITVIWLAVSLFISQVFMDSKYCTFENFYQAVVDVYGAFGSFAAVRFNVVPRQMSSRSVFMREKNIGNL